MKDPGRKTKDTEKVTSDLVTGISTWEITSTEESAARDCTPGSAETLTMESGSTVSSTDMVSGRASQETVTSDSGFKTRLTATVFILGRMETGTKANGTCA